MRSDYAGAELRRRKCAAYLPPELLPLLDPPILVLLDPLVDVALEPVVDVPLEPTAGVLGATAALLGAVLPLAVLGGLPAPNGVTRPGIAVGLGAWTVGSTAAGLPGARPLPAMHCLIHFLFNSPM